METAISQTASANFSRKSYCQEELRTLFAARLAIRHAQGVSSIDKGLETSNDGTVTLYMGPEAPKGKEGNWIPTAKGQQYYMLFRFYGADDPVFTKTWQLNDLELVE